MLNAVALLFILEIDDLLYKANMGPKGLRVRCSQSENKWTEVLRTKSSGLNF